MSNDDFYRGDPPSERPAPPSSPPPSGQPGQPGYGQPGYGQGQYGQNGAGYFAYFGASAGNSPHGWHSFNIGSWHLISLDTNWDPSGEWRGIEELLHPVDVLLPNENEAKALTGQSSLETVSDMLSQKVDTLAIKLGNRGALARQGTVSASCPAIPLQVVDTIGAGDSFDAGFLYGWLNGWELVKSLQLAVACGSLSTRAAGGTAAQPTLTEALQYVR